MMSPGDDWSALVPAVKRFEDAWRRGPRPALEDHLPGGGPLRARLLVELAHLDLELRLKAGEAARAEEYLARYPELAGDPAAAVGLIAAEHALRRRAEPELSAAEYLARFPQYRSELPREFDRATVGLARDTPSPRGWALAVPPAAVPGYEILELLGRGGMGVVYKARQRDLARLVALKFLPAECARDPQWLDRFWREAVTASALNHPNICTIYGTGECEGRPFFSMELIDGHTLRSLAGRPVAIAELARLFRQAALALAAAHAAGVVHRDVKPENLMVRADGILKVLDFGLARRLAAGAGTDPGTRVGTLLYMSPEQARAEPVDTASDVFSLGVVLYELATGRHPFRADAESGVLHTAAAPVPPSRLHPEVGGPLCGLIQQMLSPDPRRRPTAAEVAAALQESTAAPPRPKADAAPPPNRAPFVGRDREAEILADAFAAAASGRGRLLCVTGQPGLGKTTLVERFLDGLAAGGRACAVARGRCSERLAGAEAYLPLLEALDGLLRADGSAARLLRVVAPAWYAQLAAGAERPPEAAKASSQERLKRELLAFLQEASRLRPLVLFLDDVHWADASTVDLLAYLGPRCPELRVLVLVTYRPTELVLGRHPFLAVQLELQHAGVCRELPLGLLSRGEVERYLALAFAGHAFPAEFAAALHARTEGNPLFLVDLLRYLRDRGVVAAGPGGWALTRPVPDFQRGLPESVRGMLRKKIALLSKADLRLLSVAAVQGTEFDSAVAAGVLGRDPAAVEERLEALARVHGLVRLRHEHEFPDGTLSVRYRFVHALYQNTLYAALQPTRRAAWSAAVARELLARHNGRADAVAGELALLFEAAREPAPAVDCFRLAAEHAVRVSAHREAATLARRGLALLPRLPESHAGDRQELALLLALGVSLIATHGFASPEVEETYERARRLCRRAEESAVPTPVLYGLWNVYLARAELARCLDLAGQMAARAEGRPGRVPGLVAHNALQQPLFHRGELEAARRHQERGLALYDAAKHRDLTAEYGEDPGVGCLAYGGPTLWHLGYPDQAVVTARAARRLADEIGSPFNVAQALYFAAYTRVARREPAQVRELASALMELSREHDFAQLLAGGQLLHGWALAGLGHLDEGVGQMRAGLAAWQATGALSHRAYHLALLAEALGRQGQGAEALELLAEADALCEATDERFWEPELHRLRGELLRQQASDDPEAHFREALAAARRQQARSLELRAALSLGRLLRDAGRAGEARQEVGAVCRWFTEGSETPDLREARAFLEGGE